MRSSVHRLWDIKLQAQPARWIQKQAGGTDEIPGNEMAGHGSVGCPKATGVYSKRAQRVSNACAGHSGGATGGVCADGGPGLRQGFLVLVMFVGISEVLPAVGLGRQVGSGRVPVPTADFGVCTWASTGAWFRSGTTPVRTRSGGIRMTIVYPKR